MKIGVMLRSLHYLGGIGTYTQQIVKHLLAIDRQNEYVLIYPPFGQSKKSHGLYSKYENCTEVLSPSLIPHRHYWDHFVVPRIVERHGIDLIFNPCESVPLRGKFRKVFVLHNSERFIMPEVFWFFERYTGRRRMEAIMRAADCIISVSHKIAEELMQATGLPESKFRVIHNAPGGEFRPITDTTTRDVVKTKYGLPDEFVFFAGGIYPQKNFAGLLKAYRLVAQEAPHTLVVAGNIRWKSKHDLKLLKELNLEQRVQFIGWVSHEDLPTLYSVATCFVIPSFHESCSVALLEALSCGCPVVASKTGGNPEVVGEAALLVDPANTMEIKDALLKVLSDAALRRKLAKEGLVRAQDFSWEKSATETLKILEGFV